MLFTGASNYASAENDNTNPPQELTPTMLEAKQYAEYLGITIDEALIRFKLIRSFPGIENELSKYESATFGGLWIQHKPEFKIVIAFTHDGKNTLSKYISQDLPAYIDVRTVSSSYAELDNIHSKFLVELRNLRIMSVSGVYAVDNCVKFDILKTDKSILMDAIQHGIISFPDKVIINYIDALPENLYGTFYGGLPELSTTVGFTVRTYAGERGIVSCGHGNATNRVFTSVEGYPITNTYQGGACGGDFDYAWYTCDPYTTLNRNCRYYWDGSGYWALPVTNSRGIWDQRLGDIVSKFGKSSNYTAGMIINLYATVTALDPYWGIWRDYNLVQVGNCYGFPILSLGGDSGGPCFTGDGGAGLVALGILSTGDLNYQSWFCYMPINRIVNSGLSVLVTAP